MSLFFILSLEKSAKYVLCFLLATVVCFDFLFMRKSVAWATFTTLYSTWWQHVTKLGALGDERKKNKRGVGKEEKDKKGGNVYGQN